MNFEQKGDSGMAYDYSKLLGRIIEKFGTRSKYARAFGLSERSMSLKLTGQRPFKQPEIQKSCELLDINASEIPSYFFAIKVQ